MASIHPIHHPDGAYGPPEVHIPHPAEPITYPAYLQTADEDPDHESLTGEMKRDETTTEEWALSEAAFSNAVLEKIGIASNSKGQETSQEREKTSVLLPIPRSATEEKELYEKVMTSLRKTVAALEEEELFESSMKNYTQRTSAATEANGGTMAVVAGNPAGVAGESNSAGMGDQPRTGDVRELLKADTRAVWERTRERMAREA